MNEAALFRGQELNGMWFLVIGLEMNIECSILQALQVWTILLDMHLCFGVCRSQTICRGCTALCAGGVAVLYEVSTFVCFEGMMLNVRRV